jgi:hypothetical protein
MLSRFMLSRALSILRTLSPGRRRNLLVLRVVSSVAVCSFTPHPPLCMDKCVGSGSGILYRTNLAFARDLTALPTRRGIRATYRWRFARTAAALRMRTRGRWRQGSYDRLVFRWLCSIGLFTVRVCYLEISALLWLVERSAWEGCYHRRSFFCHSILWL